MLNKEELTDKHKRISEFEKEVEKLQADINTVDCIKIQVADYFRLAPHNLSKKTRLRTYLWPRQIAIYFTRKHTSFTLKDIAKMYGLTNHATIIHSIKVVSDDMVYDKRKKNQLNQIKLNLLKHGIDNDPTTERD
jgi:chromosomal replication initiator protein|tara:strand:+ start:187 stop:591 length:405 start_codon:yes stop_codon:yes gene_type:complete